MKKAGAYWDASALVPLCIHEDASQVARAQLRRFTPVVWWGSSVEVHSAICRLLRDEEITNNDRQGAISRLLMLSRGWSEILPSDDLRELAIRLLDQHVLRAADSLQLAAALVWCGQRPAKRNFVCGDRRLSEAAEALGFSVLELK
ncbi:MAG TPA: type II toxin-antitoxin system VapC family toxin [Candidatus Acidoferrum sp.]